MDISQKLASIAFVLAVAAASPASGRDVPAFPGAEGFGAKASGGRGGRVIAVTNLDDAGPGSFRAAVDEKGPRTIVFRISGNIPLNSSIKVKNGDLTIAGQTAPGDGICLQNYSLDLAGGSNVIIRYLRVRPGDAAGKGLDALGGREGENIIIDHCSTSWSIDECVSIYSGARNITVQWCLMSESLYQSVHTKGHHGFGGIWGGQNASWHHNLLAHHSSRNPRIVGKSVGGQFLDLRNNVIYNWGYNSTYGGDGDVRVNLINNFYKPGPATRENVRARVANPSKGEVPNNWWIAGNLVIGSPEVSSDNWLGVHPVAESAVNEIRAEKAFEAAPVTTQPAEEAFELVLKHAGANSPQRDSVDARIVEEARMGNAKFGGAYGDGKGIIDSPKTVGGWPELKSLPSPVDADGDGMPDEWELRFKFNLGNSSDAFLDSDNDGYTNLEEFLNGTDPSKFVDYTRPENNVNTLHNR
jgi:pectate lyase